jgi:ATP-dependent Clp protease protease subunit
MPIGVPRIIYCWGEELPAQWTDIYNFIFRRRMVFLMQYLDDELCNQICGLLINIHMEDRSKELEKKEMEKSGLFKGPKSTRSGEAPTSAFQTKKERSIEDLMISEEDLGIDDNHQLERHTLQKISLEWLNWNAQFFDYSEEPYMFYLAELLSNDLTGKNGQSMVDLNSEFQNGELTQLMTLFKHMTSSGQDFNPSLFDSQFGSKDPLNIYSPFRLLSNLSSQDYKNFQLDAETKNQLAKKFQQLQKDQFQQNSTNSNLQYLVSDFAQKDLLSKLENPSDQLNFAEKAITQRQLRKDFSSENRFSKNSCNHASSYLNLSASEDAAYLEYRDSYRRQAERAIQEEESKKVFMIINSFGGSVGNGITVHDALQFIKAGSMTLALGVAASAASLALAGGTIGERYVTEGCHVMIHQPEGGLSGQASDIWIDSQEIMKIRLDVAEIYSLSTYRPRHKILRDLDRDFYLTATETIYYGLADEIATNEVMHEIIEMTSKVWDYHDTQQQKLLETRDSATSGLDTQTQN